MTQLELDHDHDHDAQAPSAMATAHALEHHKASVCFLNMYRTHLHARARDDHDPAAGHQSITCHHQHATASSAHSTGHSPCWLRKSVRSAGAASRLGTQRRQACPCTCGHTDTPHPARRQPPQPRPAGPTSLWGTWPVERSTPTPGRVRTTLGGDSCWGLGCRCRLESPRQGTAGASCLA